MSCRSAAPCRTALARISPARLRAASSRGGGSWRCISRRRSSSSWRSRSPCTQRPCGSVSSRRRGPAKPGHSFSSSSCPDGASSLAFDASPASGESASEHLKAVAFVDGEQVLTLVGTQSELLVTGTKDHRTFIRKARLACGGREWHQVTLEFPTGARREYARMGEQAVRALELADDDGCAALLLGMNLLARTARRRKDKHHHDHSPQMRHHPTHQQLPARRKSIELSLTSPWGEERELLIRVVCLTDYL
jgi:hypothetical protein